MLPLKNVNARSGVGSFLPPNAEEDKRLSSESALNIEYRDDVVTMK